MRALLILVLAGCLLWLALQGFRSVRASDEARPEPQRGYILPPRESAPATPAAVAPADPMPAEPEPVAAAIAPAVPVAEVAKDLERPAPPAPQVPPASASPPTSDSATPRSARPEPTPDEVGAASLILYRPDQLQAFLEGPGRSLPPDRSLLARALQRLLDGDLAQARRLAEDLEAADAARSDETAFLEHALAHPDDSSADPLDPGGSPMIFAAALSRLAQRGAEELAAGRSREAAAAYGRLLQGALDAPWKAEAPSLQKWSEALRSSQAGHRWSPRGDWSSIAVRVEPGDSLISVRKKALDTRPELLVCTGQIARANGLQSGVIHPGDVLRIPTAHANVLVDLDSHWALYRLDEEVVAGWEIGVGKPGSETPPGEYRVGEKTEKPMWFRAGHEPVPFGDPQNPLGTRWIAWQHLDGRKSSLGFHGTSEPTSIGEDRSQGCVRMRQADVEELFEILPRNAVVHVRI